MGGAKAHYDGIVAFSETDSGLIGGSLFGGGLAPEEGGKLDPVEEFIKPIPRPGRAPLTINNLKAMTKSKNQAKKTVCYAEFAHDPSQCGRHRRGSQRACGGCAR